MSHSSVLLATLYGSGPGSFFFAKKQTVFCAIGSKAALASMLARRIATDSFLKKNVSKNQAGTRWPELFSMKLAERFRAVSVRVRGIASSPKFSFLGGFERLVNLNGAPRAT